MSSDMLDLLLDDVREPWPVDNDFVQSVMSEVRTSSQRRTLRWGRRQMVVTLAAGAVVMGGAVAAVVTTSPPVVHQTKHSAAPITPSKVVAPTDPSVVVSASPAHASSAPSASVVVQKARGYVTDHSSFAIDARTGLKLLTESYTNDFTTGKAQRITLTMINTGRQPIAFDASKDCALQVMAFPVGQGDASTYTNPQDYSGNFEWVCAGTDADPRTQSIPDSFVLAPGASRTLDAHLTLKRPGEWNVLGMCKCSYSKVSPTATPKHGPITLLTGRALPATLLPQKYDGSDLTTPPIRVRAEQP